MTYNNIELENAPSPAFAMAYYSTGVEFGTFKDNKFSWGDKHKESDLSELHIFNEIMEYRAVLSNGKCTIATIKDEPNLEHIDEYMRFFGEEHLECNEGKTKLKDKGSVKEIYLKISESDFKEGISFGVRNYLDYDDNDMIKVVNYRLLGLFKGKVIIKVNKDEKEVLQNAI